MFKKSGQGTIYTVATSSSKNRSTVHCSGERMALNISNISFRYERKSNIPPLNLRFFPGREGFAVALYVVGGGRDTGLW